MSEGIMRLLTEPSPDYARTTAKIEMTTGSEVWVCNPWHELVDAVQEGYIFVAHELMGLVELNTHTRPVIINPAHIVTARVTSWE